MRYTTGSIVLSLFKQADYNQGSLLAFNCTTTSQLHHGCYAVKPGVTSDVEPCHDACTRSLGYFKNGK